MSAGTSGPSPATEALIEERDFLLRSLRDLDQERDAGEIDPDDYATLRDRYVRRAAEVARRMERLEEGPADDGVAQPPAPSGAPPDGSGESGQPVGVGGSEQLRRTDRSRHRRLRRSLNGLGVALCLGGVGWAAAAATGAQLPGGVITGDAIGPQKIAEELIGAAKASGRNQPLQALRDYQAVLDQQPDNPTALTGEAAVLLESNRAELVGRGAVMLAKAEQADPSYAPAYIYLGRALIILGDYGRAEKQLRTFISDDPKGTPATEARKLLAYAAKRVAGTSAKAGTGGAGTGGQAGTGAKAGIGGKAG